MTNTKYKYPRFTRVSAPILGETRGNGTVDAYIAPVGAALLGVLVRFDKKDFPKDQWQRISPTGKSCVFERFPEDSLAEPIAEIVPGIVEVEVEILEKPIDSLAELVEPDDAPWSDTPTPVIEKPVVIPVGAVVPNGPELHQVWKSNRGPSRYEIVEIEGIDITLKEIGISYKRDTLWAKLVKGYTYEGMVA